MIKKRIFQNTLLLYMRQIIISVINLYVLRIVLNELGVEDYGLYGAVAGFVTLLAFLPSSMASATQRFFSYYIGKNDKEKLRKIFNLNLLIYFCIAILAWAVLETVGLWYVSSQLKIPLGRFDTALILYHYLTLAFILSIFTSPFIAIFISQEDISLYALISIIETLLKLIVAFSLKYISGDLLVYYSKALMLVSLVVTSLYIVVCALKHEECRLQKKFWDAGLLKEIVGFTGWTLFGQLSTAFRNQAVTVLINQFFTPITVAARLIATTVSSQALVFANNLNVSLYPPIIKAYASQKKEEMFGLINNGSKLTFFFMWVFALPMIMEMKSILWIWLKTPPEEAVVFTKLALVESLILSVSLPLTTAARAPGKMKLYETVLGFIQILIFVASWLFLGNGYSAISVFVIAILANIIMFFVRLIIVQVLIGLSLKKYCYEVLLPLTKIILLSILLSVCFRGLLGDGLISSALFVIFSVVITSVLTFFFGFEEEWRKRILNMLKDKLRLKSN